MCQSLLRIPQATKLGWIEVRSGGVFDWSYPTSKLRRGRVQGEYGDISPTITCNPECLCVYKIIESDMTRTKLNRYVWYCYRKYEKRVGTDKAREEVSRIFDITVVEKERIKDSEQDNVVIQQDAMNKVMAILEEWEIYKPWMLDAIAEYTHTFHSKKDAIRFLSDITPIRKAIRKLTERECFRLMDVNESDIDKIQDSGVSRSQQYKMAGNSIVVACMEGIFYNLFSNQEQETLTLF